jgi:hypothetical protein
MSDHSSDEIRDLLARAMSDAPEPHAWNDVEQRARQHDAPPPRRRTGVWLAAAACTVALLGGLVAVVGFDDEPSVPVDDPDSPAPSTVDSTSTPTTAAPGIEDGWTGGLLDDIDVESLRPLESLDASQGDVVVPTGPSGWRVSDSGLSDPDDDNAIEWSVDVTEARPDYALGHVLYLTQSREPVCQTTLGCQPSGETVTIDGVVWEAIVVERIPENDPEFFDVTTLRARVGDRWVSLASGAHQALTGPLLENPPIIEFLEGLRVGTPEDLRTIGEACWQCGGVGGGAEGDPFAAGAPATTTATSEPPNRTPDDFGSETGRPLTELAPGDIVVPTYIPPGRTLSTGAQIYEHAGGTSEFSFTLESADGQYSNMVRLWESDGTGRPLDRAALDDPNHPPVEIAGITWGWNDFESARVANIGSSSVWVSLHGLDRSEAERFIEGLRAASVEEFPGPIASDGADGLSVIDPSGSDEAEVVASDDQFQLTAVRVGDRVCTKLEQLAVPVTMTFAANCWETTMFADSGIVDFVSLDPADTSQLFIGVIDAPSATAVRISSPDGESVVVPTGPVNQAIDGRFFLARLELDIGDGIRLDRFTIEDASP